MNSTPDQPPAPQSRPSPPRTGRAAMRSQARRKPKALPFALVPAVAAIACDPNNQAIPQSIIHDQPSPCLPSPPSSSEAPVPSPPPPPPPDVASSTLGLAAPPSSIASTGTTKALHPFFQPRCKKQHPTDSEQEHALPHPPEPNTTSAADNVIDLTNNPSSPISLAPPKPVHPFFTRLSSAQSDVPPPPPEPTLRRSTRRHLPARTQGEQGDADFVPSTSSSPPKRKRARTAIDSAVASRKKAQRKAPPRPRSDRGASSDDDSDDSDVVECSDDPLVDGDPAVQEQARILAMIQARKRSDDLMRKFYKPPAAQEAPGNAGGGFFAPKQRKRKVEVDDPEIQVADAAPSEPFDKGALADRLNHPIRNSSSKKIKELPAPWPTRDNVHVGGPEPSISPRDLGVPWRHVDSAPAAPCPIPPWLLADTHPPPAPTLSIHSPPPALRPSAAPSCSRLWTDKYAPRGVHDLCGSNLRHAARQVLAWLQEQLSAGGNVGAPKRVRDRILGKRRRGADGELDDFVVEDSDVESDIEGPEQEEEVEEAIDVVGLGSEPKQEDDDEQEDFHEPDPSDDDDFIGPSTATRLRRRNPHAPRAASTKPRYGPGALVLSGPPGSGKSALLHALCAQLALTVFEVHAGHRRAAKDIEHLLGQVADTHSVCAPVGAHGVLVVDAANIVFDEDRSMWQGVASVAVKTRRPLVIVVDQGCEDLVPRDLVHVALQVALERPSFKAVVRRVGGVLAKERPEVMWEEDSVEEIVCARCPDRKGADLRAALMQAQFEAARPVVLQDQAVEAAKRAHCEDLDDLTTQLDAHAHRDVLESAVERVIPYRNEPELPSATHPDALAVDLETVWVVPSSVMYHQAAVDVDKTVEWTRCLRHGDREVVPNSVEKAPDPPALTKVIHTWTGCQRSGAPTVTPSGMRVDLVPAITLLARLDLACMDEAEMAMAAATSGGARRTRRRMYQPVVKLEGVKREELEEILAHRRVFCLDEKERQTVADVKVGLVD